MCLSRQAYYGGSCATVLGLAVWLPGAKTPVYVDSVSRNLRHTSAVAETVIANTFEAFPSTWPHTQ